MIRKTSLFIVFLTLTCAALEAKADSEKRVKTDYGSREYWSCSTTEEGRDTLIKWSADKTGDFFAIIDIDGQQLLGHFYPMGLTHRLDFEQDVESYPDRTTKTHKYSIIIGVDGSSRYFNAADVSDVTIIYCYLSPWDGDPTVEEWEKRQGETK